MRLLVSVADVEDARAALAGRADIIDAKDPLTGALGAVALETFRRIRDVVRGNTPVSAAIGDATDGMAAARLARDFASAGASFVKVGFGGNTDRVSVADLLRAAVQGAAETEPATDAATTTPCRVVAVVYADSGVSLEEQTWIGDAALHAGARGILLDTMHKTGPGLCDLTSRTDLLTWITAMASRGLEVALAGRLGDADLALVRDLGADIAGVRGAVCHGSRSGRVLAQRVRALRSVLSGASDRRPAAAHAVGVGSRHKD